MAFISERAANKLASRLTLETYRATTPDLEEAIDHLARGFRLLRELGAPSKNMAEMIGGTLDMIANIDAARINAMDEANMRADEVDISELVALHGKVTGGK